MPFFRINAPPLGVACLYAYLKKYGPRGLDLRCTDFRLFKNDVQTFTYLGYRDNFAIEIPDLALILAIVKNFQENSPILKDIDKVIKDHVQIQPLNFFKLQDEIKEVYNIISTHLQELISSDIVLFTTYESNFFFTIMCSLLLRRRKPNITIIYGGPQVTQSEYSRKLVLKLGVADIVVIGEGEETLLNIIKAYKSGRQLSVKGTMSYIKNKDSFLTKPSEPLDLNILPCPDFSILNLNGYFKKNLELPLYTSRGCVFSCNFCNEWRMWHRFRQISPEKVVGWMKNLNQKYGAFRFYFADSLLNTSLPWLDKFSDTLLKNKLDFQWHGYFRANMNRQLVEKLKASGLCRAFVGVETFSQALLEKMNKKRTAIDNMESIEAFTSCGIPLEISNIVGFPSESKVDFQKRWEFYLELITKYPKIDLNIESFQFRPCSRIYDHYKDFGLSIKKWGPKTANIIPEVRGIVRQIPMAVKGKPNHSQIFQRKRMMEATFKDEYLNSRFEFICQKEFLKKALRHTKKTYKIILATANIYVSQVKLKKNLYLLKRENQAYPISEKEKIMLDNFDGNQPLSKIAQRLSARFHLDRAKAGKIILKFLGDLLDRDILFQIMP